MTRFAKDTSAKIAHPQPLLLEGGEILDDEEDKGNPRDVFRDIVESNVESGSCSGSGSSGNSRDKNTTNKSKRYWSKMEDDCLSRLVEQHGARRWPKLAHLMETEHRYRRSASQCRDRWLNHLDPSICRAPITPHELAQILQLKHDSNYGTCWTKIARALGGRRTGLQVKNAAHLYERQQRRGEAPTLPAVNTRPLKKRFVQPSAGKSADGHQQQQQQRQWRRRDRPTSPIRIRLKQARHDSRHHRRRTDASRHFVFDEAVDIGDYQQQQQKSIQGEMEIEGTPLFSHAESHCSSSETDSAEILESPMRRRSSSSNVFEDLRLINLLSQHHHHHH